jgi:hypothetical protein
VDDDLLGDLGSVLGAAGNQASKLVSCYVRAGAGSPPTWNYTLVPFSTGSAIPVPIFFTGAAAGTSVGQGQGTVTATIDLAAVASGTLSVTFDITIDKAKIAALVDPRLELVVSPDQTVVFSGSAPPRLSVIVLSLGQGIADLPGHVQLKAELPISGDGVTSTATVSLVVEPVGVPVSVWLTDAPTVVHPAWFGTSVGTAGLPAPLKSTLQSLISLAGVLGVLGDPVVTLQLVNQALTVDTDQPSTGSRIDLDLSGTPKPVHVGATVTTPWSAPTRPPVTANPSTPDPARSYRYLAAVIRPDGTESGAGAPSDLVHAAVGSSVTVTAPAKPSTGTFSTWRIYRSQLGPEGGSRPVPIGDVGAGAALTDTIPTNVALANAEASTTPPLPLSLDLAWGTATTTVSPAPLPLPVKVRTYDESLPTNTDPDTILNVAGLQLPASGSASLHPNRGNTTPFTLSWKASATPLTVDFTQPRSNTDIHLDLAPLPHVDAVAALDVATLATVTWNATAATTVTGHVRLPPALQVDDLAVHLPNQVSVALHAAPEKRVGYPVDVLQLGWTASGAADLQANLALTDAKKKTTTGTAVVVEGLPANVAIRLVSPHTDDPDLAPDAGKRQEDAEVDVAVGSWSNAPALPKAATDSPAVGNDKTSTIRRVLLRTAPTKVSLPGVGPGPRIAAALDALAEGGSTLRLRVDYLRSFSLHRPAGETVSFEVRADIAELPAARIALSTISKEPVTLPVTTGGATQERHSSVQVRVHRVHAPLHLTVGLASVDRDTGRYDAGDDGDRPSELTVTLHEDSALIDGLRVLTSSWLKDQAPTTQTIASIDQVPSNSSIALLPVPGTIDPTNPANLSWRKSGGMRVRAHVVGGGRTLRLAQTTSDGPPVVDADVRVPENLVLALGGDVGTLKANSDGTKIVDDDIDVAFPGDWHGRPISWHRGSGTIASVSAHELALTSVTGSNPDPNLPEVLRWYRVGTPAESTGVRLDAKGSVVVARVGLVTPDNAANTLRATTAGPKLRLEQRDDLMTAERRGEVAAVAARLTAGSAQLSAWTGSQPADRLRGSTLPVAQSDVLALQPSKLDWVHAALELDPARGNRSLNVTGRVTSPAPGSNRDAIRLRLRGTPDKPTILLGPGTTEIQADMTFGPGAVRAEPAQWVRGAMTAEAGYVSAGIEQFPTYVMLGSAWRIPELVNELDGDDFDDTIFLGSQEVKKWQLPVTRILAGGGELKLGRVSSVAWSSVGLDNDGDPESPWTGSGDWAWGLSDIWFLQLKPNDGATAEVLIHAPGEPKPKGKSDVQVNVNGGQLTARLFVIDMGEHPHVAGRRAAADASAFKHDLKAEVQMEAVEGRFAVGPEVGLDWDPVRPFQDDDTTSSSQWWLASYSYVFGWPVQFGSDGGFGQFDAPWDPYWS